MLEAKNPNPSSDFTSSSPIVIAFKPRQVLLAEAAKSKMTATATTEKQRKTQKLEPEKKVLLHHAIFRYLEQNAFSKTLKRFQSEAQIENNDWNASSFDLEDIFCKHLDACSHSDANLKTTKELESGVDGKSNCATTEEVTKKKKKRRGNESDSDAVIDPSKAIDKKLPESAKNSGEILADSTTTEAKPKEKKKKRKDLDTPDQTEQVKSDALNKPANDSANKVDTNELPKNTKDKRKDKKKKDKSRADSSVEVVVPEETVNADTGTEEFQPSPDATKNEKKSSKKRKRLASDEKEDQSAKVETVEETKRRKTEGSEEVNHENLLNGNGNVNGHTESNAGEKSDSKKSTKKQHNGSAEPKTINAFQRVKIDEVEFADDKLQDNSYWAKGGAEVGYGAKAQEVLGQVRGRDFRHEKTKKKRGSYRGGMIDLQSHSVKFNYSDEE